MKIIAFPEKNIKKKKQLSKQKDFQGRASF